MTISKHEVLWLRFYSLGNKRLTIDYVPENIYYTKIEPLLNEIAYSISYSDKNFYELFYKGNLFPETIIHCVDDCYYNQKYELTCIHSDKELNQKLSSNKNLIVKPSIESGGGSGVKLFQNINGVFKSDDDFLTLSFLESFHGNFVIQSVIQQHPFFQQFCKSSVNTIRILTYRSVTSNKVHVLHGILRVGVEGSHVDNANSGGFSIGLDEFGVLNKMAFKKSGIQYSTINGFSLDKHLVIPCFKQLKQQAVEIAQRNIHHRLLGLDMVLTINNEVKCIEVNNTNNEINFYQLNNGSLFGRFTDEVIEYCNNNKKRLYSKYDV